MRTLIEQLPSLAGQEVHIKAWVDTVRDQKAVSFLVVHDHTGAAQITIVRSMTPELSSLVATLIPGSVVSIKGSAKLDERVKLGGVEVLAKEIEVLSLAEASPLGDDAGPEARQEHRHIDLRREEMRLLFAVETTAQEAMREFWLSRGLSELHSPKLLGAPSESGAELFELEYFGRKAYLAQSPQFYKQAAIASDYGFGEGVFEIAPVFRAERSMGPRHATEFISVDVELSFVDGVEDVMKFEEEWLAFVLAKIKAKHGEEIQRVFETEVVVPTTPFPRLTLAEVSSKVIELGHHMTEKGDLDPSGEQILSKYIKETYGHEFVFVTKWPTPLRPFYHERSGDETESFDLIWKGLEITTGAKREHRYDVLCKQAQEAGLGSSVDFYLEFFRYGCPPHGGFGFGLARFMMLLTGLSSIKDSSFFFRGPTRLEP